MATTYQTPGSATSASAGSGTGTQLFSGIDLYSILQDAAQDAVGAGSIDDITDRMTRYIDGRLSPMLSNYDFFLSVTLNNSSGSGGWGRNGTIFRGQTMWGGDAGMLPGIGAQYGVACTVVWL